MRNKLRFEELTFRKKKNEIFDKRFSSGSVLEKIPSKELPQFIENLVTPRRPTNLGPISNKSTTKSSIDSQCNLFTIIKPLSTSNDKARKSILRENRPKKDTLHNNLNPKEGLNYLEKRNREAAKSKNQIAESVAFLSKVAQTQRSQLSSLLLELDKEDENTLKQQQNNRFKNLPDDFQNIRLPFGRKFSHDVARVEGLNDTDLNKIIDSVSPDEEQKQTLDKLILSSVNPKSSARRRYVPPLMNLSEREKKEIVKRKCQLIKSERAEHLSLNHKDSTNNPSGKIRSKWNSLTVNQFNGSSNIFSNSDSLYPVLQNSKDFSTLIEKKICKSKFAAKNNYFIDMKSLVNLDQDENKEDSGKLQGIKKFKILKKKSLIDEINNITFKKFYDMERGKTLYGDVENQSKKNDDEQYFKDQDPLEDHQKVAPDYEFFSMKVNKLLGKLDNFMTQGFGVHDVINQDENSENDFIKRDDKKKGNTLIKRGSTMYQPGRPYRELLEKLKMCVKGLISMKLHNLNFPMKEILHDLGRTQIFSNKPFEKPNSQRFIAAAKVGNRYTISALLVQNRYLVYDFDHFNLTALHWSSKRGHFEVTELLLQAGADVNAKDMLDRTPLYMAVKHNNLKVMQLLLWYQASPWSSSSLDYQKVLTDKPLATKLIKKSRKIHIVLKMSPPHLRKNYWLREGQVLMIDPETNENIYFHKRHLEI